VRAVVVVVPDVSMGRLALPEDLEKEGVIGLRMRINGRRDLLFFAPDGHEFSYRGSKLKGPIAHLPAGDVPGTSNGTHVP